MNVLGKDRSKKDEIDEGITEHESFGMIQINRVQGNSSPLFGCSIEHQNTVVLRIYNARNQRTLNKDWTYTSGVPIVEIEMSPVQYAEALTTMNTSGTPCTIRQIQGRDIESRPIDNKREQIEKEFSTKLAALEKISQSMITSANRILEKGIINVTDKKELKKILDKIDQEISRNLPFVKAQFTEQMDYTVTEAKAAYEAHIQHRAMTLGFEALQNQSNTKSELERINTRLTGESIDVVSSRPNKEEK